MKRYLALILLLSSLLMNLTACGTNPEKSTAAQAVSSKIAESSVKITATGTEFSVSEDEFVKIIDEKLDNSGYTKLSSLTHNEEASKKPNESFDVYTLTKNRSAFLFIHKNTANNKITCINFIFKNKEISDDELESCQTLIANVIESLEGELVNNAIDQLNLSNTTEESITQKHGDYFNYIYKVDNESSALIIEPYTGK